MLQPVPCDLPRRRWATSPTPESQPDLQDMEFQFTKDHINWSQLAFLLQALGYIPDSQPDLQDMLCRWVVAYRCAFSSGRVGLSVNGHTCSCLFWQAHCKTGFPVHKQRPALPLSPCPAAHCFSWFAPPCSRSLMCHLRSDEDLYRELSTKLKPQARPGLPVAPDLAQCSLRSCLFMPVRG